MSSLALLDQSIITIDSEVNAMKKEIDRLYEEIRAKTLIRNDLEQQAEAIEFVALETASFEEKIAYYLDFTRGISNNRYNNGTLFFFENFDVVYSEANEKLGQMKLLIQLFPCNFDEKEDFIKKVKTANDSIARLEPFLIKNTEGFGEVDLVYGDNSFLTVLVNSRTVRIVLSGDIFYERPEEIYEGSSFFDAFISLHHHYSQKNLNL